MLRPRPAAKAMAFRNGLFGTPGWSTVCLKIAGKERIVMFPLLVPRLSCFNIRKACSVVENLGRSRSLDTLIVVKSCHAVFAPLNTLRIQGLRCNRWG